MVGESGRKTLGTTGVYRASGGGVLEVRKRINHPPDAPLGRVEAAGGLVLLQHPKGDGVVIRCDLADVATNGVIELADSSRLELAGSNGLLTIAPGGTVQSASGLFTPLALWSRGTS